MTAVSATDAQQMALPLVPPRPALVRVTVPAALTDAQREQYRRLIAHLVVWPRPAAEGSK